jgi:methionyl-tRNA formyltransferase
MKIIFFGTPEFVVPVVSHLHKNFPDSLVAVVTQPPKEVGRDKKIERSAIDNWAFKHKIEVIYDYSAIPSADLGIVAAYGRIIPQEIIEKFEYGLLNIHPSLLPKYRGASPIQFQISSGETQTGVTVIKMDEKMDHGPIVSQLKDEILPDDTNETLRKRLFEKSAQFLVELIPNFINGKINLKEQNHDVATFTKILNKNDGFVGDPFADPLNTERKFRAFQPWPGIWTHVKLGEQKRLKLNKLHLENNELILEEVQLEGKNPVSWSDFKHAYPNAQFADELEPPLS